MWGLQETLNSMFSYQIWDIGIKLFAAFGTIGTLIAGVAAYFKYRHEKNRQLLEKRLNEVYAPLYRIFVIQETYRKLFVPHIGFDRAPIIHTKVINKNLKKVQNGQNIDIYEEITETDGRLTREKFFETLDKTNFGLARPKLLALISKYELLVYLEDDWKQGIDWETLTHEQKQEYSNYPEIIKILDERVKVARLLVKEIVDGYEETVKKLGIGIEYKSIDKYDVT